MLATRVASVEHVVCASAAYWVLRDSQAILVYLAAKYGGEAWPPTKCRTDPLQRAWLTSLAKFSYAIDKNDTIKRSGRILPLIDAHLSNNRIMK
jgi:glutathione S-transferase